MKTNQQNTERNHRDGRQYALPTSAIRNPQSAFLAWLVLVLFVTGCAGTRPLKGGKALTTHSPGGAIQQSLVQGENPSQASKQDQESVKVRTYTVPAGSRMEQAFNADCGVRSAKGGKVKAGSAECGVRSAECGRPKGQSGNGQVLK
jgi:hypothetical protein